MTAVDTKYGLSAPAKIFAVITCALLTGCLWRLRGELGFGGTWGMLAVAAGVTMLIFALFGKREKITYEMLPLSVLAMSLTAGGWGTLNSQMAGFLASSANFAGEEAARIIEINPFSGLFIMLCLGFGWMPLFACLLGSMFSKKRYGAGNYILLVAVYFGALFVFKATVSHLIVRFACSQAVELFEAGLLDTGSELSVYRAYMENFFAESAAKVIPGGRNYFASISAVSAALAAGVMMAVERFALKDKLASLIAFGVNAVCAVAITAADIFLVIGYEKNIFHIYTVPGWIEPCRWSLWEFFTGFLIGLGIMLIIVLLPKSVVYDNAKAANTPLLRKRGTIFAYSTLLTLFGSLCLTLVRALGIRLSEQLAEVRGLPGFFYSDSLEGVIIAVFGIAALLLCAYAAYKNIIFRGLPVPAGMGIERFCKKRLPLFFAACSFIYFFTGNAYLLKINYAKITPPTLLTALREGLNGSNIIMLISTLLFFASYAALIHFMQNNQKTLMQK